jgi:hypothetical protein
MKIGMLVHFRSWSDGGSRCYPGFITQVNARYEPDHGMINIFVMGPQATNPAYPMMELRGGIIENAYWGLTGAGAWHWPDECNVGA